MKCRPARRTLTREFHSDLPPSPSRYHNISPMSIIRIKNIKPISGKNVKNGAVLYGRLQRHLIVRSGGQCISPVRSSMTNLTSVLWKQRLSARRRGPCGAERPARSRGRRHCCHPRQAQKGGSILTDAPALCHALFSCSACCLAFHAAYFRCPSVLPRNTYSTGSLHQRTTSSPAGRGWR